MKTLFPRLSSIIAALLLSCGLAKAAESFDMISHGQLPSEAAMSPTSQCGSSCIGPR